MSRVLSQHEAKDWGSVRPNKNGCLHVVPLLEAELASAERSDRLRALHAIEARLNGEGYFCHALAQSQLVEMLVRLACGGGGGASGPEEDEVGALAASILARGCTFHHVFLNQVARQHAREVVDALHARPREDLFVVVEAMAASPRWVAQVRRNEGLVRLLARDDVQRFAVLEKMPQQAIEAGAVDVCLRAVAAAASLSARSLSREPAEQAPVALKCLLALSTLPAGRDLAIQGAGVRTLVKVLTAASLSTASKASAAAALTNLLQDPTHAAKAQALELDAGRTLHTLLAVGGAGTSKAATDLVLSALQAIAAYCSHPLARQAFLERGYLERVRALAYSDNALVQRTAKVTTEVLTRKP
jgi:hypothetical protein